MFTYLLPLFIAETGIEVRVVAQGTGQAIETARRGDADVLFVHHKPSEEKFVAEGEGVARFDVMYNDFVLVGPTADPAGIRGMTDAAAAMAKIAVARAPFLSRGDDSGTHLAGAGAVEGGRDRRQGGEWRAGTAKPGPAWARPSTPAARCRPMC